MTYVNNIFDLSVFKLIIKYYQKESRPAPGSYVYHFIFLNNRFLQVSHNGQYATLISGSWLSPEEFLFYCFLATY